MSELLDSVDAPDLAVLQALAMLHGEGLVEPVDVDAPPAPEPLLSAAEAHAVRARAQRGRGAARNQVVKVLLGARDAAAAREALAGLPLLAPEGAPVQALGTVAELEVAEGLLLHFCIVPAGELGRPLWRAFTADGAGLVLVDVAPAMLALARFVADEQHAPLAVLGERCPDELAGRGARRTRGPARRSARCCWPTPGSPADPGPRVAEQLPPAPLERRLAAGPRAPRPCRAPGGAGRTRPR